MHCKDFRLTLKGQLVTGQRPGWQHLSCSLGKRPGEAQLHAHWANAQACNTCQGLQIWRILHSRRNCFRADAWWHGCNVYTCVYVNNCVVDSFGKLLATVDVRYDMA